MSAASSTAPRSIETIATTKLVPPRPPRRVLARDALIERLLEARRKRCLVVQGPAGSGKTSTLVAWQQRLLALDFDVAWLSLAPDDNELTRFFDCLLASLAAVDPTIVQDTARLAGRDSEAAAAEHWIITLVQSLAQRRRELVLVLDDVQQLDDPRIFRVLQWLLDYAPPNLHLAIGTRSALPLALGRLREQGQLAEFDLRDLRFTAEESERFLREQLGSIDKRDALKLHELTDGWVAGLQLFVLDLKSRDGQGPVPYQGAVRDAQAFADYFERELLGRLQAEDVALLTRMSLCNRFCASLCATLDCHPQAVAAMTTQLARLDRDNLFISQVSSRDRQTWYRLHPLLREVLAARLAAWPPAELAALHRQAWRWFDDHGHLDEAVRHAVLAGDAGAAAELVEARAPELLERSELGHLAALLKRLPPSQLRQRFELRLVQLNLQLLSRDLDAAQRNLDELQADAGALNPAQRYALTLMRSGIALQRDDSAAVAALEGELLAIPEPAAPHAFSGCSKVLGWLYANRGEHERARAILAEGMQRTAVLWRRLTALGLEGMSHALEGQMAQAELKLGEAMRAVEREPDLDIGVVCMAAGLYSDALYEADQLDAALRLLQPRLDLLEHTAIPDAALRALIVLACVHWIRGQRLQALEYVDRLEDYGTRHGQSRALAHALSMRLRWHLRQGETDAAEALGTRLDALQRRHADSAPGTGAEVRMFAQRGRAELHLHWHDFGAAAARRAGRESQSRTCGRTSSA